MPQVTVLYAIAQTALHIRDCLIPIIGPNTQAQGTAIFITIQVPVYLNDPQLNMYHHRARLACKQINH